MHIKKRLLNVLSNGNSLINKICASDTNIHITHQPVFVIGMGRSGTHFLAKLMETDPAFFSAHLDTLNVSEADSFCIYALWYELEVDHEPFRIFRKNLIAHSEINGKIYFESNPYLSFAIKLLNDWFDSKFIFLVRNPIVVINSYYVKGVYSVLPNRKNPELAPILQPGVKINHYFGRILPKGNYYKDWCEMTQVGKLSWLWNNYNLHIARMLQDIPDSKYMLVKLEDINYEKYKSIHKFSGGSNPLNEKYFHKIRNNRPGKGKIHRTLTSWNEKEKTEFLTQSQEALKRFDFKIAL